MEAVKNFCKNTTTSNQSYWTSLVTGLNTAVYQIELNDLIVKEIIYRLGSNLLRFRPARNVVHCVLVRLLSEYPKASVQAMTTVLSSHSPSFTNIAGSASQAKLALVPLKWACLLLQKSEISLKSLELLSTFLAAIPDAISTQRMHRQACGHVIKFLNSSPKLAVRSLELLLTSSSFPLCNMVLIGVLVAFLCKHEGKVEFPLSLYQDILKLFAMSILGSRERPEQLIIKSCKDVFKKVSHLLFKEFLYPAMLKALLRNPDELMSTVSFVVSSVPIDLSSYTDIAKNVFPYLSSPCQNTREEAQGLMEALAKQCSDKAAAQELQLRFSDALKCSPASKLTVAEHRCSILTSMRALVLCPLSSSSQQEVASEAAKILVAHMKQEVHVGTCVVAVNVLCAFCLNLPQDHQPTLDLIKESLNSKTTPPPVRVAYLMCVLALCREEGNSALLPLSLISLTRLSSSSSLKAAALEEAVIAARVLIKIDSLEPIPAKVWDLANSHAEQLFSHKVLSAASENSLPVMVEVARALLCALDCKLEEASQREWLGCLVKILFRSPWRTRQLAAKSIKTVVGTRPILAEHLLDILTDIVNKGNFSAKWLLLALESLTTPTHPNRDMLAVRSLLMAHHPDIAILNASAWLGLLKMSRIDPSSLLSSSSHELASTLTSNMATRHGACVRALKTLVVCGCESVVCVLVEGVCDLLEEKAVVRATQEDMEVMCTAQGELWHAGFRKELEAGLMVGAVSTANMKKESKIYSFEDQKWAIELRQEMLSRKREESGGKSNNARELLQTAKLSVKLKEAIEAQLTSEEELRKHLMELKEKLVERVELVEVVGMEGEIGMDALLPHIPRLCHVTLGAAHSPLGKPYSRRLWELLSSVVFRDWTLALLYAETTFCTLTSNVLSPILPRIFLQLKGKNPSTLNLNSAQCILTLPLLQLILVSLDTKAVSHDFKETGMYMLNGAVDRHLEGLDKDELSDFDQDLFPSTGILQVLSSVIAMDDESVKTAKIKDSCVSMFVSLLPRVMEYALPVVREALFHACFLLRHTVLRALTILPISALPSDSQLLVGLLVAQHDEKEPNRTLASSLLKKHKCDQLLTPDLSGLLIQHCYNSNLTIQTHAAKAMGVWLETHSDETDQMLDQLVSTYHTHLTTPPPSKDAFGREIFVEYRDNWQCRVGVAKTMEQLSTRANITQAMTFLKFVIPGALSDPNPKVQHAIIVGAQTAISCHGNSLEVELMHHAEESLKTIPDILEADRVRQSIIVLMGTLAKHMDKDSPKVKAVVHLLLGNLDTPSQQVQEAIAGCLPPLAPVIKEDASTIIQKLLEKLLESPSYSQRKGSAYGLASLVKGLGIPTLKKFQVMATLKEAIKNKKNYRYREGALFAFQCLCNMLGRLFEPYVVHLLPDLLICFGDGNQYVREATDLTARTIMAHLSSHGVKLILPSLLVALEDEDSWRTKAGSAELLGAMAFCAPKQLSSCLPSIVPRLMAVLADSHSKVQAAGTQALKQIGSVIKNPEIQSLVPVLLEALSDPSNKAGASLQALLDTEFVHIIDPPSLALIMPTLKRTLDLRSTDTKKMAAQIIGNMYSLTDKKDLNPYLSDVLPGLKQSLVDPVPEVRNVCAKALGAIARGMGEEGLGELLPWLMVTLKSDGTSVDRSGAAQGLSEVLYAQGVEQLRKVMPQFILASQDSSSSPHARDGYLMMFVYLPMTFGNQFSGFIGDILVPILKGLADESEFIRETSLLAGQTIVNRYSDKAVELFLPQLEKGLFDENWRIRCSSIQLFGDLLYKISGVSGKMSTESEEDDNFGTEAAHQVLLKSLGRDCRDRVFAGLYMGRLDVALIVRQASLHVWKVVVANTARTLREILPTLVRLLLSCLGSHSPDKRKVAARTLGDLVRKLGERVLPEVIPMLEQGMESESKQERQGVCIGLSEIIQQTSREHVLLYIESLLPTVQSSLCDRDPDVRAAAAMTFDSLHSAIGPRVLDQVLTPLLLGISEETDESEIALDALRQLMAVKSRVVLPHVVPQLIQPPVNIRALALLTSVAGEALSKHLNRIIPALVQSLSHIPQDERVWQYAEEVVLSVQKEPGPAFLVEELVKCAHDVRPEIRAVSVHLLFTLCGRSSADLSEHLPYLMIFTTETLNDPSDLVCEKAWLGLDAIIKRINSKELPHHTGYFRKALRTVSTKLIGDHLRGFDLKGITPALTLLKEGLISGSPDEKEESARVLVEVIQLTSPATLSSGKVVMMIAGPLIRVLGDRYSWNIKVATLEALVALLRKVGVAAKAFIPQLQTSYLKALNDPNKPVRVQAVTGLIELLPFSPRVDPVFKDLHNGIKKSEEAGLRLTMLQALQGVIKTSGQRMSEQYLDEILCTLIALQGTAHEGHRLEAATCVGSLCAYLSDTQLQNTLATHILDLNDVCDWAVLQARAISISTALLVAAPRITNLGMRDVVCACVVNLASSDRVPVCESGLQSICSYLNHLKGDGAEVIPTLCQGLAHSSVDVKVVACDVCAELMSPADGLLTSVIPLLLQNGREKNTALRTSVDHALINLVQGDVHLKHISGLLDVSTSRKLEEAYLKSQARQARKGFS